MRKVIHTAPKFIFSNILKDMESYNLIKIIKEKVLITNNKSHLSKLKKLKEYIFPINPNYYTDW